MITEYQEFCRLQVLGRAAIVVAGRPQKGQFMAKPLRKKQAKLARRIASEEAIQKRLSPSQIAGRKMPGSMNLRKQG